MISKSVKRALKMGIDSARLYYPARWIHRHKALILMYHGLTDDPSCRLWTQVHVSSFEKQMRYLREHYNVVPLSRLVKSLAGNRKSTYQACVTFDDGYRSVATMAAPILKQLEIPATVYVTSGFMAEDSSATHYMWPDLVHVLLRGFSEPSLDLSKFGLEEMMFQEDSSGPQLLVERLKCVKPAVRAGVLDYLESRFGHNLEQQQPPEYEPMSWDDVHDMMKGGLISIGGHTRTHPILSYLDDQELEEEILGGKRDLESRLGVPILHFAYPNGRMIDIGKNSVEMVSSAFDSAVTTIRGFNTPGSDAFMLERFGIGNELTQPQFRALVSGMYGS